MKTEEELQGFVLAEIYNDLCQKNEQKIQWPDDHVICNRFFEGCPIDIYAQFASKTVNLINDHTLGGIDELDYNIWVMASNVIYESLYAGLADDESTSALYLHALKGDKHYEDLKSWFLNNHESWIETILGDFDPLEDSNWLHWLDVSSSAGWGSKNELPVLAYLSNIERHIPRWDEKLYDKAIKEYHEITQTADSNEDTKKEETAKPVDVVEHGNVYLMVNNINGRIKIGKTSDETPVYRERTLQSQEPDVTLLFYKKVLYMSKTERFLHSFFKDQRFRGEWFDLNEEHIKQAQAMITKAVGEPIHKTT